MNAPDDPRASVRRAPPWIWVAFALLLAQGALLAVLALRPGRVAMSLFQAGPWMLLGAAAVTVAVALVELVRLGRGSGAGRPSGGPPPAGALHVRVLALAALVATASASLTQYRVYPSSHDGRPSARCFRLPLDGNVSVVQGGESPEDNYHAAFPSERYAYDLGIDRDGWTWRHGGYRVRDYFAYDAPVLAPAAGTVVLVHDGEVDQSPADPRWYPYGSPGGNHVVLDVGNGEYVVLAHLRPGSIAVRERQWVAEGQRIARVGNSGRSGAPHLHVHLQDAPGIHEGEGIPMPFCDYLAWPPGGEATAARYVARGIPTGKLRRQVVRAAGRG